jgi:hypothetical protein
VHVAVRQGVDEPVLLSMASGEQKPKRLLMLFPGGDGIMRIQQKDGRPWFQLLGNYLLRSRALFVDDEQVAVSVDMPSDEYCCANDRFRLGAKVAGVVLTTTVTRPARDGPGLSGFDFGTLKVPVLFVHHKFDACFVSPYSAVSKIAANGRFPVVTVTGSRDTRGPDCEVYSYHGYAGREKQVAAAITQWAKTRAVAPTIE